MAMSKHAPSRRTVDRRTPVKRAATPQSTAQKVESETEDQERAECPGLVLDALHGGSGLGEQASAMAEAAGRCLAVGARSMADALVQKDVQDVPCTPGPATDLTKG